MSETSENAMNQLETICQHIQTLMGQAQQQNSKKTKQTTKVPKTDKLTVEALSQKLNQLVSQNTKPQGVSPPIQITKENVEALLTQISQAQNTKITTVTFPDGTPDFVSKIMLSGMTEKQITAELTKQAKKNTEIMNWVIAAEQRGRPKDELKKYFAVKKALREALDIKKNTTAAKETAVTIAQTMSVTTDSDSANSVSSMIAGTVPLKKFINPNNNAVFLLWSDYLAASDGNYSLRFRKFSAGENSKPQKGPPSIYFIKGESKDSQGKIITKMNAEEFITFLGFINQLSTNGKLADIFRTLVASK